VRVARTREGVTALSRAVSCVTFDPPSWPSMRAWAMSGTRAMVPSDGEPCTQVCGTPFHVLWCALAKRENAVPHAVPRSMCHAIRRVRGFGRR
jgi:hypothetical protein